MAVVFVVLDVFLIGVVALLQHPPDTYSEGEADIAVDLHPLGKPEGVHGAEHVDERVVTCYLLVALRDEVVEGTCLALEVLPQFRSLMACVGKVEDVVGFLRVEHQGYLRRLVTDFFQLVHHLLVHELGLVQLPGLFEMLCDQLVP